MFSYFNIKNNQCWPIIDQIFHSTSEIKNITSHLKVSNFNYVFKVHCFSLLKIKVTVSKYAILKLKFYFHPCYMLQNKLATRINEKIAIL